VAVAAPLPAQLSQYTFQFLVDSASVALFVNDGLAASSKTVFADEVYNTIDLVIENGELLVDDLVVHRLLL
jgi:sucrose-6-phosphate hydrolase SacC (GH32 family)